MTIVFVTLFQSDSSADRPVVRVCSSGGAAEAWRQDIARDCWGDLGDHPERPATDDPRVLADAWFHQGDYDDGCGGIDEFYVVQCEVEGGAMKLKPTRSPQQLIRDNSVGRGRLPWQLRKPTIYFGGRIIITDGEPHDWRDSIDGFNIVDADRRRVDEVLDCGTFWYGGPFPKSNLGHSNGHGYYNFWDDHRDIWDADAQQIARADLFVAYINDLHAYGTLVEIGFAAGKGKLIILGFSDDLAFDDFMELWLCRMPAARVYRGTPEQVWWSIKRDWIAPQTANQQEQV